MVSDVAGGMLGSSAGPRRGRGGANPDAGLSRDPEFQVSPEEVCQSSI